MKEKSEAENIASVVGGEVINDIEELEKQLESGGDFVPKDSEVEPGKKQESSGLGEMCAMITEALCGKMAQAYNEPSLAMTAPEKDMFVESINDVASYYDIHAHPLVGFGIVVAAVSIPRYITVQAIIEAHANKKPGDDNGDQS